MSFKRQMMMKRIADVVEGEIFCILRSNSGNFAVPGFYRRDFGLLVDYSEFSSFRGLDDLFLPWFFRFLFSIRLFFHVKK
jgi:hypothetical protein